jgi:hypothetical protein
MWLAVFVILVEFYRPALTLALSPSGDHADLIIGLANSLPL